MRFEWDEAKAAANIEAHDIEFQLAAKVFDDPNGIVELDNSADDEERWRLVGFAEGKVLLFVVYTERGKDLFRIISARKASKREQDRYYRQALH